MGLQQQRPQRRAVSEWVQCPQWRPGCQKPYAHGAVEGMDQQSSLSFILSSLVLLLVPLNRVVWLAHEWSSPDCHLQITCQSSNGFCPMTSLRRVALVIKSNGACEYSYHWVGPPASGSLTQGEQGEGCFFREPATSYWDFQNASDKVVAAIVTAFVKPS